MKALQTHGKFVETWYPPSPDRFTIYQQSDESWLRPLGFGTINRVPAPLFDVRLITDQSLVGYISHDPTKHHDSQLTFSVLLDQPPRISFFGEKPSLHERLNLGTVTLFARSYCLNREFFGCWFAKPEDVPSLLRSNCLTHGPDNIEQFIHELWMNELNRFRFNWMRNF